MEYDSYEQYLAAQKTGGKLPSQFLRNFLSKLEFIHWIMLVALILVINSLIKKGENPNWLFIALGVIIILWILSLFNKVGDKTPLPRHIAEKIALNDLNRLIEINSAYPHGTKAIATGAFKAHHTDAGDDRGWSLDKYNFGFIVKTPGKSDTHVIYQMNPYPPGDCLGIIESQMPWDGADVKDVQIIVPEKTIIEQSNKEKKF
jgi:hypothetical protein